MQITGQTDLFYIVGAPVSHFRAPLLFNAHYAEAGRDFCSAPLHVLPKDLAAALNLVRVVDNIRGLCITAPHKIAAAPLVDSLTPSAAQAGSVNFVRRLPDGTLLGHNLDGLGFLRGLRAAGFDPKGARVLLLGAGGVGRAIAFALAEAGVADLSILNRDTAKAKALAAEIAGAKSVTQPDLSAYDLVVNATSVGMGGSAEAPVNLTGLAAGSFVADVVISPTDTPLIAQAKAMGFAVMAGGAMLRPQIELSLPFLYDPLP